MRYYLGKEDTSGLDSILFSVSSQQHVLECSVLNLHILITKKHLIKLIIHVSYKIDKTKKKLVAALYELHQKYLQLGKIYM